MYFDVNAKRINSPTYKIIMYLHKYESKILEDNNIILLFNNLKTHFKKLFHKVTYISKIQKDYDFIEKYDQTLIASISSIEYCYYKISTIFDITYQISSKLIIFPGNKQFNRYDYLENQFEAYTNNLKALQLDWYKNLNKIRNKIVHGGIKINPYYVNDGNIKKNLLSGVRF